MLQNNLKRSKEAYYELENIIKNAINSGKRVFINIVKPEDRGKKNWIKRGIIGISLIGLVLTTLYLLNNNNKDE